MTPTLTNGDPQNYLGYALFVTDCNGNRVALTATVINFDLDAVLSGVADDQPLTYTVSSNGAQVVGDLVKVPNADLFGNTGSQYFHYATDQPFSLSAAATVTIAIQLAGRSLRPIGNEANSSQVQTYLGFGAAAPVTAVVQLLGPLVE